MLFMVKPPRGGPRRPHPGRRQDGKSPRRDAGRRAISAHETLPAIEIDGDPAAGATLEAGWRAAEGDGRELTHGFHAYPARLHPRVTRALIAAFSQPGDLVVDPFAGAGTVLVEAFVAGRAALGCDVNEIAVRLAFLKSRRLGGALRRGIEEAAARIAREAAHRARGVAPPHDEHDEKEEPRPRDRRDDAEDRDEEPGKPARKTPWERKRSPDAAELTRWFEPDVQVELATMRRAIAKESDSLRRFALEMVLSSIVIRVSQKAAETVDAERVGRVPPGAAGRFFRDRAVELGAGLADLSRLAPRDSREPVVVRADARSLPLRDGAASLVLTSPPYLGTYDYAAVQDLRAHLLGFSLDVARRHEIGARTERSDARAIPAFRNALTAALREMRRVLVTGGRAIVVLGDSVYDARPVDGLRLVKEAARDAGLEYVATASEDRPASHATWQRGRRMVRREHLVLLARS
jgi:DNA modification methylase